MTTTEMILYYFPIAQKAVNKTASETITEIGSIGKVQHNSRI